VIVAQAAATVADLFDGRFFLGLGTGEALNEHITGAHWPPVSVRRGMLREAVALIRQLWAGDYVTQRGTYYTVENARIYTLPKALPPIAIAAGGPDAARLAGEVGDAVISTAPTRALVTANPKSTLTTVPCGAPATLVEAPMGAPQCVPQHHDEIARGTCAVSVVSHARGGPDAASTRATTAVSTRSG